MLTSFSGRCITRTINASLGRRRRRRKPEKAKYLSGAFRSVHVTFLPPLPSLAVAPT